MNLIGSRGEPDKDSVYTFEFSGEEMDLILGGLWLLASEMHRLGLGKPEIELYNDITAAILPF
jgi:hypothetical protein